MALSPFETSKTASIAQRPGARSMAATSTVSRPLLPIPSRENVLTA